jgi:hypothetical protein
MCALTGRPALAGRLHPIVGELIEPGFKPSDNGVAHIWNFDTYQWASADLSTKKCFAGKASNRTFSRFHQ